MSHFQRPKHAALLLLATLGLSACGGGGGSSSASNAGPVPLPTRFVRQDINQSDYPGAVCNDGTPAVFYAQAGVGANAAADAGKTVIYLQGGGFCTSDADCQARLAGLTSSASYPAQAVPGGILSSTAENTTFRSWNRVLVRYCSSDLWTGDTGPSGGTTNFQFRGARIVNAVIGTLRTRYGIGKTGDVVLFGGGSAGGVGSFVNANRVRAQLPTATVLSLVDGAVFPDVAPPATPTPPVAASIRDVLDRGRRYWNGQLDADCLAAHPAEPTRCYQYQDAAATVRTPMFAAQNLRDPTGIQNVGFFTPMPGFDAPANSSWINSVYIPGLRAILGASGPVPTQSLFAACDADIHTFADDTASWTQTFAGLSGASLSQRLAEWASASGATASRAMAPACAYP